MFHRARGQRKWRRAAVGAVAATAVLGVPALTFSQASAGAQAPAAGEQPLSVTYVARVCDDYSQIMANKARNNIQESLRDLGPNSNYASTEAVSAAKEAAGTPVPPCRPLPGWRFSTGTGIIGRSPATEQLSTLSGLIRSDIVTQASAPELDAQGNPTGGTLQGAVTVQLNGSEQSATARNSLLAQGGTPSQPLNGLQDQYAFGALRCAQDAQNGDNVDYVSFPPNTRHVFCYYYAVTPPPGQGEITVRKEVAPGSNAGGSFHFDGNISYQDSNGDGEGDFDLSASPGSPGEMTFIRAQSKPGQPWTFKEDLPPGSGWQLTGAPKCTILNSTGGPGTGKVFVDSAGQAAVELANGDHVTCTYTNERETGAALLQKQTVGGTGTFHIGLDVPPGADPIEVKDVTTERPGVPVDVATAPQGAPPGDYTAVEQVPAPTPYGTWELTDAYCNGQRVPIVRHAPTPQYPNGYWTVTHHLASAEDASCLLTDTFTPGGAISVEKVTEGGTGTFGYTITPHLAGVPATGRAGSYTGNATTTRPGVPAGAVRPDGTPGPLADGLEIGPHRRYTIQEVIPPATEAGTWHVTSASCDGAPVDTSQVERGVIDVELTPEHPRPVCRFVNTLVPPATVGLVKHTSGDPALRPSNARLSVICVNRDGGTLEVPVGASTAALEPRLSTLQPTTCQARESATGAGPDVTVHTTAVLHAGDETRGYTLGTPFRVEPGTDYTVEVSNTLSKPTPPPTAPPTTTPTAPPTVTPTNPPGHPGHGLPPTGADMMTPFLTASIGLLGLGGLVLALAVVVRRRR